MPSFFPTDTVQWKVEESPAFRRVTISIWETAIVTGIVMRLLRSLLFSRPASGVAFGIAIAFLGVLLAAALTAHVGNYPLRHWVWRVPGFAAIESAAESLVSLALIAMHREPNGSGRAEMADWGSMALTTFMSRLLECVVYALILAGVVQFVRYVLLPRAEQEDLDAEESREEIEGVG